MHDYATLRQRMVDNQIRPSEVTDHEVLKAFLNTPRELFVAPSEQPFAYADRDLRMGEKNRDRAMIPAVQQARLVQALPRGAATKLAVIGCGTGYSVAILSRLAAWVVAVEEDETLAGAARDRLRNLGAVNVAVVQAPLTEGHPAEAPYDGILVDGAVEYVPDALIRQLRRGGLLAVIERGERVSRAMLYERVGDDAAGWPLFDAWAPLLPGFERPREFVF